MYSPLWRAEQSYIGANDRLLRPDCSRSVDRRLEMNCGLSRMGNFDAGLPLVTFSGRATRRFEAEHPSTNGDSSWGESIAM
jgi:hypothetical protein